MSDNMQGMADIAPPQDEPMSDEELAEMFRFMGANTEISGRGDEKGQP